MKKQRRGYLTGGGATAILENQVLTIGHIAWRARPSRRGTSRDDPRTIGGILQDVSLAHFPGQIRPGPMRRQR